MDKDNNITYKHCTNKEINSEIKTADRGRISIIQWYDRFSAR